MHIMHGCGEDAPLLDEDHEGVESADDENASLRDPAFCTVHRREAPVTDSDWHKSIAVPDQGQASFCKRLGSVLGPGYLVAVGYMDPGNWATDIAAGSAYDYKLLFVILVSSLMAMFLQALALRLGLAAQMDLAQACRAHFSRPVSLVLWVLAEIAIVACDLAEVVGSAIALKLLFGLPMVWGVACTAADVLVLLAVGGKSMRVLELVIVALMSVIVVCFAIELYLVRPDPGGVLRGTLVPAPDLLTDQKMLLISVGILGATVMPHNLYLHSSVVQSRGAQCGAHATASLIHLATIDSNLALTLAFCVNAAILILAAAAFHRTGHTDVTDIDEAYVMLSHILGEQLSSVLFAVALLASGQQSTLTGTLAGCCACVCVCAWRVAVCLHVCCVSTVCLSRGSRKNQSLTPRGTCHALATQARL